MFHLKQIIWCDFGHKCTIIPLLVLQRKYLEVTTSLFMSHLKQIWAVRFVASPAGGAGVRRKPWRKNEEEICTRKSSRILHAWEFFFPFCGLSRYNFLLSSAGQFNDATVGVEAVRRWWAVTSRRLISNAGQWTPGPEVLLFWQLGWGSSTWSVCLTERELLRTDRTRGLNPKEGFILGRDEYLRRWSCF